MPTVKLHRCLFTFIHNDLDGSAYRAESEEMAETINAGRLFEHAGAAGTPAAGRS